METGEKESEQGEQNQMAARGVSWVPIVFILIILSFAAFTIPLSPSLSVSVKISTKLAYPSAVMIEALTSNYQRVPISTTPVAGKNVVVLDTLTGATGNYQIVVALSYKGEEIAASAFLNLGDGTYQARIVLWPRWSEDPKAQE